MYYSHKAKENDDNFEVKLFYPGINKENCEVTAHGKTLTVKHEHFTKDYRLPDNTSKKITADCKDGILTISIPKSKGTLIPIS